MLIKAAEAAAAANNRFMMPISAGDRRVDRAIQGRMGQVPYPTCTVASSSVSASVLERRQDVAVLGEAGSLGAFGIRFWSDPDFRIFWDSKFAVPYWLGWNTGRRGGRKQPGQSASLLVLNIERSLFLT